MKSYKNTLSNLFNLKSGKASHIALGVLTYLGSSQAITIGLMMAGIAAPGASLVGGISGALLGFSNYYTLQQRRGAGSPVKTMARNAGFTLASAFGGAVAAGMFTTAAVPLAVAGGLGVAAGALQYMAAPKGANPFKGKSLGFKRRM